MLLRRFLILAPVVLALALLQSYFWVPTYEAQTTGNPKRVWKFIDASIGDAKLLNPALNADTASSQIAGLVFDGLLRVDENLELEGRLATQWSITELVYLMVLASERFPDREPVTGEELERRLRRSLDGGSLASLREDVIDLRRVPPQRSSHQLSVTDEQGRPSAVSVEVRLPERIEFRLREVDQDFLAKLAPVIGPNYGETLVPAELANVPDSEGPQPSPEQIAALVEVMEHNPVIEFELREGVTFHDGHPFDAGDVRFTYEAIMEPKNLSPRTSDFEPIKRVDVVDPLTVRVTYKRLHSPAINSWTMGILPEHLLDARAMAEELDERGIEAAMRETFGMRDSRFNRNPVGTGPFRFVSWESDELIHLARYDEYWEGPAQFEDYYYRVIPDPLTQELEFLTGAVDRYSPEPHQIARYRGADDYQSFSSPSFSYTYIGYNNRRPLFADKRVRRALAMAINVGDIIEYILYGEAERTTGPFPKVTDWYDPEVEPVPYDPQGAVEILESLGWSRNADGWLEKDGEIFEFNLITNNGNLVRKAIMTTAQNSWRKIGIKCNTSQYEWAVFLEDFVNPAEFDAVILGWSLGLDPDLYQLWHSSQSGWAQLNFVGYDNPEADALILRIRREYDRAAQVELTHQLHAVIAEDQPYTFLFTGLSTQVLDKKIVMVEEDGSFAALRATKSGSVFYYFDQWRKLEHAPDF